MTSGAASARCCRRRRRSATRSSIVSNPASSAGHAFGNLLIAALAATTGDFVAGVEEAARVLGTVGRVLPATEVPVVLKAQMASGELVGQVRISKGGEIATVSLVPPDATPPPARARGDRRGGPDRARTGVAVHERARRLRRPGDPRGARRRGDRTRVYVANLREQVPETAGFDVARLLASLRAHEVPVDVVLADRPALPLGELPGEVRLVRRRPRQ